MATRSYFLFFSHDDAVWFSETTKDLLTFDRLALADDRGETTLLRKLEVQYDTSCSSYLCRSREHEMAGRQARHSRFDHSVVDLRIHTN